MNVLADFRRHGGYDRWEQWLAWPLVALGLAFLVVLILPLARPLTPAQAELLTWLNLGIWVFFVLDYVARLYLAPERGRFLRTHVLDLIVVAVPFVRPFRLLRLFAIVASTTRRAGGLIVRRVLLYVTAVAVIVMAVTAVVVYNQEHGVPGANITSLGDSLWWAITTMSTVGYGDYYPVTATGRMAASVLMVTGIALLGVITAGIASWFVNTVRQATTADVDESMVHDHSEILRELRALRALIEDLQSQMRAGMSGQPNDHAPDEGDA